MKEKSFLYFRAFAMFGCSILFFSVTSSTVLEYLLVSSIGLVIWIVELNKRLKLIEKRNQYEEATKNAYWR